MNIFRFIGDMSHLLSFFVLMHKINRTRSCKGVSLKTQELYLLVFLMRYLDLFTTYISLYRYHPAIVKLALILVAWYNTVMKLVFIGATAAVVYQMRYARVIKVTYDAERDTFKHWLLVVASLFLALIIHERIHPLGTLHYFMEILWQSSIYLESVAILPQLTLVIRTQNIDNLTSNYILLLGIYRLFYIFNWVLRYFTEPHYVHWLVWIAGLVQTGLYADFFYYYYVAWRDNKSLRLPA